MRADVQVCTCSFRAGVQAILRGSVIWRFKSQELSYEIVRQKRICDLGFCSGVKVISGGKTCGHMRFGLWALSFIISFIFWFSPAPFAPAPFRTLNVWATYDAERHGGVNLYVAHITSPAKVCGPGLFQSALLAQLARLRRGGY